jgi:hypothetical protein
MNLLELDVSQQVLLEETYPGVAAVKPREPTSELRRITRGRSG